MAQTFAPKSADQGRSAPEVGAAAEHALAQDQNLRIAARLVRTLAEQDEALRQAYERGWADCGNAMAHFAAQEWERGYDAAGTDRLIEWDRLQSQIHQLSSAWSMSFEDRRAAEIAAIEARPNDFLGVERDPTYIDRCRASLEAMTRNTHLRAA